MTQTPDSRNSLFISYASEDIVFAKWLARRLASCGYDVWMDRLKMLGGESWTVDIDDAIRTRVFRVLAIISRFSLNKPSPRRERTFAQRLAEETGVRDFLIPLNLDGLTRDELSWTLSDTCDIHFSPSWASGLDQLFEKLDLIAAPKVHNGVETLVASSTAGSEFLASDGETLISNCLTVTSIPDVIRRFRLTRELSRDAFRELTMRWPIFQIDGHTVLAFDLPSVEVRNEWGIQDAGVPVWKELESIDGVYSRNVVVGLIHKSLDHYFTIKGLVFDTKLKQWYFPGGLLPGHRLPYCRLNGSRSRIDVIGQRKFRDTQYRHHLSPGLSVLPGIHDPFLLYLRNRVYLTDLQGRPFEGRSVNARRKHLCKNWWNDQWLARTLAICQFLADGDGFIRIGSDPSSQLVIDGRPATVDSPIRLDESGAVEIPDEYRGRDGEFESDLRLDELSGSEE